MGEPAVDVTVITRFRDSDALMSAVGSWIERGCLRLPALIECGRTFQIALLTSIGDTAVRGSVEGIRQDGKSTYVRFLSAANDQTDGGVWFDLIDSDVVVPPTLRTVTGRARSISGEIVTQVKPTPQPSRGDVDSEWASGTPIPTAAPQARPPTQAPRAQSPAPRAISATPRPSSPAPAPAPSAPTTDARPLPSLKSPPPPRLTMRGTVQDGPTPAPTNASALGAPLPQKPTVVEPRARRAPSPRPQSAMHAIARSQVVMPAAAPAHDIGPIVEIEAMPPPQAAAAAPAPPPPPPAPVTSVPTPTIAVSPTPVPLAMPVDVRMPTGQVAMPAPPAIMPASTTSPPLGALSIELEPETRPQIPPPQLPPQTIPPPAMSRPQTIPPPVVAMWATPAGQTGAYFVTPAPGWTPDPATTEQDGTLRARPPTAPPPGWSPDQPQGGMSGMWMVPVVDPSMLPPQLAPAQPAVRPSRVPMFAAIAIAAAGAVVAISAVVWARGMSEGPAAPTMAAAPAAACTPDPAPVVTPDPRPATATPAVAASRATTAKPAPTARTTGVAPTAAEPVPAAGPTTPAPTTVVAAIAPKTAMTPPTPAATAPAASGDHCQVKITASANEVGVFVGGHRRGTAPMTLALPCEPTAVTFRHNGRRYVDQTRKVVPTIEGATLHASMDRPKALLKVVSKPAGASVSLDGRDIGKTPLVRKVNGFESMTLTVKAPGMVTERRLVYPKSGTTVVAATLKKKKK
jgi:hypothetical protein